MELMCISCVHRKKRWIIWTGTSAASMLGSCNAGGPHHSIHTLLRIVKWGLNFNFVGRILGPRGTTVKELEKETGCKIMVRGKGSMRDKKKEEQNRGKPNWEHLTDELHVLVTVEDTPNRAQEKLQYAVNEINKLLVPAADGEDELKKKQLMELAIMNGTYRDTSGKIGNGNDCQTRILHPMASLGSPTMRSPVAPLGVPLILTPRMTMQAGAAMLNGGGPPPLIAPNDAGLLYSPYPEYHQYAALTSPLLSSDYQAAVAEHLSNSGAGGLFAR
ncbi:Protein held out wings [Nymphon striatum]|nr:Protein held out wings [Nymphon striatum]